MLAVVAGRSVQLSIDVQVGDDGLHGRIRRDREPAAGFTGWLGLLSALDRLISDAGDAPERSEGER